MASAVLNSRGEAGVRGLMLNNTEVLKMTVAALILITGWDFECFIFGSFVDQKT